MSADPQKTSLDLWHQAFCPRPIRADCPCCSTMHGEGNNHLWRWISCH